MKLICEGWDNSGIINILIQDDKKTYRYEYTVDAAFIPGWRKRMKYYPGLVLNEIKRKATHIRKLG